MTATTAVADNLIYEEGTGYLEVFPLLAEEHYLLCLLTDVFAFWQQIQFGILIQGSVIEFTPPNAPSLIKLKDGYLTISFGLSSHFHLCIGKNIGTKRFPTSESLQKTRRVARAELYRILNPAMEPTSWGLRFFNGKNEQMLTIFLPNPLLSDCHKIAKQPDYTKLELWLLLRLRYLNLSEPDPRDYLAKRFIHCC